MTRGPRVLLALAGAFALFVADISSAQEPQPADRVQAFFTAIQAGDVASITGTLRTSPKFVSATDEFGRLPLEIASQCDAADADPVHGKHTGNWARIVSLLLEHGADANPSDRFQPIALCSAGSKQVAELLLAAGAHVDAVDERGSTPLIYAALGRHSEVVGLLLAHGADIDHRDADGRSAVEHAARQYDVEMVAFLGARRATGAGLLAAAYAGSADAVRKLLAGPPEARASTRTTALLLAVHARHIEVARILLREHADPNCTDFEMKSPLQEAVLAGDFEMAKLLLESGARVDSALDGLSRFTENPLRNAVIDMNEKMVALLLEHGAATHDLERLVLDDTTPTPTILELAIDAGSLAIVKLLLDHGVAPDGRDDARCDPLAVAANKGDRAVLELLFAHGADPSGSAALDFAIGRDDSGMTEFLLEHGFAPNDAQIVGRGALQSAVRMKNRALIERLLARGMDPDRINSERESSLDVAVELGDMGLIQLLLDHGARVEPTNALDVGPLQVAAKNGNRAALELLLARGADIERVNDQGETALEVAAGSGDLALVEFLLTKNARIVPANFWDGGALRSAAINGKRAVVELLLARGADLLRVDSSGNSLLDEVLEGDDRAMKEFLIARGARPGREHRGLLLDAVSNGDVAMVKLLLEVQRDRFGSVLDDGATLLHLAAAAGRAEVASVLLAAGAPADSRDGRASTPLHFASNKAVAMILIGAGAPIDAENQAGQTPLYLALDAEVATALLEHRADPEHVDLAGWTPLMFTALQGRIDDMSRLLAHGAALDTPGRDGSSALDLAARANVEVSVSFLCSKRAIGSELVLAVQSGDAAAVKALLDGPKQFPPGAKATALFMACARGRADLAALALAAHAEACCVDDEQRTPLHLAVAADRLELARLLLANGAKPDLKSTANATPLSLATARQNREMVALLIEHGANLEAEVYDTSEGVYMTPLVQAVRGGRAEFVLFLLDHGASANGKGDERTSPLICAVERGDEPAVEMLLAHGANAKVVTNLGLTCLDTAVDRNDLTMASALLEHGGLVNKPDFMGQRILDRAEEAGAVEMAKLLRKHGAYNEKLIDELFATIRGTDGFEGPNRVEEILQAAPAMTAEKRDGDTPLLAAVKYSDFLTVAAVARAKPDPNVVDAAGFTPLWWASTNSISAALVLTLSPDVNARNGEFGATVLMVTARHVGDEARQFASILLDHGADIAAKDSKDEATALHYAASESDAAMIALLASRGAPLNARLKTGETAVWLALLQKRREPLEALLKAGADANLVDFTLNFTPLGYACFKGDEDIAQLLIGGGVNVNLPFRDGGTALHCAAVGGNIKCLSALLDAGADVNSKLSNGMTPYDMAELETVHSYLRSRGGLPSSELR